MPFVFDPGQGMPLFDGDDLNRFVAQASWLAFNDYEAKLMQERTGKSPEQLAREVQAVIVTRGGQGSSIFTKGNVIDIPAAPARHLADPTGCGDAYRGGLLRLNFGQVSLRKKFKLEKSNLKKSNGKR